MKYYILTILTLFLFTGCIRQEQKIQINKNFNQLFDSDKWIPANSPKEINIKEAKNGQ